MIDPNRPLDSFLGLAVLGVVAGVVLLAWQLVGRWF